MLSHKEKLDRIASIKPESEFRLVLLDLLRKMGYEDTQHTHQYGRPEFGKDIIAAYRHPIGGKEWTAFVVKIGRIGGGTNDIETIKNQINQCFEYAYKGVNGDVNINKVKVVSNENITGGAQEAISRSIMGSRNANVEFWKGERLVDLIDDHYPEFWEPIPAALREYCSRATQELHEEYELKGITLEKANKSALQRFVNLFVEPTIVERRVDESESGKDSKQVKQARVRMYEIIESDEHFVLSGEPGAGKTRILDQVAKYYLDPNVATEEKVLPIRIDADILVSENTSIDEFIAHKIGNIIPEYKGRLDLESFHKLLLIDRVDFLSEEERLQLMDSLCKYVRSSASRFILAARVSEGFDFAETSLDARHLRVLNFDGRQVKTFITKYFEDSTRGKKFVTLLEESNLLERIPTTPLTLTLMSLLYEQNEYEVPATQTDIYDDFTSVLLGKLEVRNKHELLQLKVKRRIIAVIALRLLDERVGEVDLQRFAEHVNSFLERKGFEAQSLESIRSIIENAGFLYVDEHGMVGFKHQSFVEYFASIEIYDHRRADYYEKLLVNFNQPNWQSTAIFFAGRSKDMPNFVADLLESMPNSTVRDLGVNIGGLGYLGQALYMTDLEYKKRLVEVALENTYALLEKLRVQTSDKDSGFHSLPLNILVLTLSYWFSLNFKSVTLKSALQGVYDDLVAKGDTEDVENFRLGLMLFLLASTLMHKYIDDPSKFEDLLERPCFMRDPVLILVGDIFLEAGETADNATRKDFAKKLHKQVRKYRKVLLAITKEPAYRLDSQYRMLESDDEKSDD